MQCAAATTGAPPTVAVASCPTRLTFDRPARTPPSAAPEDPGAPSQPVKPTKGKPLAGSAPGRRLLLRLLLLALFALLALSAALLGGAASRAVRRDAAAAAAVRQVPSSVSSTADRSASPQPRRALPPRGDGRQRQGGGAEKARTPAAAETATPPQPPPRPAPPAPPPRPRGRSSSEYPAAAGARVRALAVASARARRAAAARAPRRRPPPPRAWPELPGDGDGSRAAAVVEVTRGAWGAYCRDAMGADELRPLARSGSSSLGGIGGSVLDAMSTLALMGLSDEVARASAWVRANFSFDAGPRAYERDEPGTESFVGVFETAIRGVGGLLSAAQLTGDGELGAAAARLAARLLPAFDTPTGLPHGWVQLVNGSARSPGRCPACHAVRGAAAAVCVCLGGGACGRG